MDPSSVAADGSATSAGSPEFGRYLGYSCSNWTNSNTSGFALLPGGGADFYANCATPKPLACCNSQPKINFVGFTSAPAVLSPTGRPAMHAACGAEFAGSHMCHASEYHRSMNAVPIPASGAWIDPSSDLSSGATAGSAPKYGRFLGYSCSNWTNTNTSGMAILPTSGFDFYANCATPRPIACCIDG